MSEQAIFEETLSGAIDTPVESIKGTRERLNGYQSLTIAALWHGWRWRAAKAKQDEAAAVAENLRLMAEISGPDGFETWRDAAVAERMKRVAAENERDRYKFLLFERSESSGGWVPVAEGAPTLSDDVLVTLLIDGTDTDWKAGYWDGEHWYTLDTEHDEPIQVNAGCNFVVTHWAYVNPAEQGLTDE